MKHSYLILLFIVGLIVVSCSDDDSDDPQVCNTTDLTYTADIANILNNNCAVSGCHDAAAAYTFPLADYASASYAVSFNRIVGAINHNTGFLPMPYPPGTAKLEQCSIDQITAWIADGAPE